MTRLIRRSVVAAAMTASLGLIAMSATAAPAALAALPSAEAVVSVGSALVTASFGEGDTAAAVKAKKKTTKKKAKKTTKKKITKKKTPVKKPASTPAPTTPPAAAPAPAPVTPTAVEERVIALTNSQRAANGCAPLRTDAALTAAARAHSADMAAYNYFSHTGRDGSTFVQRAARAGYTNASAENIAWGYRSADEVVTGWMNSEGHRRNILNCSSVAVGVGIGTKPDGTPYYTQVFGRS